MSKTAKILYASRALESPPREGGFVLLKDIASNLKSSRLKAYMLSSDEKEINRISPERAFHNTGWGRREKLDFFRAILSKSGKYDIVHTAHIPTLANSRYMRMLTKRAKKKGAQFVQTITGLPKIDDGRLTDLLWGDYLVFQSPSAMQRATKVTTKPAEVIVPWPSDVRVNYNSVRRQKTRESLNIDKETRLVVFPGEFARMGIGTEFSDCIQAFIAKQPKSLIIIACRFDDQNIGGQLESMHPDHVRSVGGTSNIIELMEAADLVIFPTKKMDSKFHPPLIITEALSLGTPVLVSDMIDMDDAAIPLLTKIKKPVSWSDFGVKMGSIVTTSSPKRVASNGFGSMLKSYELIYKKLLDIT